MKRFFFFLILGIFHLFSIFPIEKNPIFIYVDEEFQKRWVDLKKDQMPFILWKPNWTEKELQNQFEQLQASRFKLYFESSDECKKEKKDRCYKTLYEPPKNFDLLKSRYSFSRAFNYNLASSTYDASIITLNGKRFIAMEGPSLGNLDGFKTLLSDYKITDLVRLAPAIYKGKENCYPYWEGHININPKNGRSTLEIAEKEINYFFTDSWTNARSVSIEPERLIALIKVLINEENESISQMIAIHCRAGIDRTGVFLAAYALIQEIDRQIERKISTSDLRISIDEVIWKLSLQRPFMINHYPLYKVLYQTITKYIEIIKSNAKS